MTAITVRPANSKDIDGIVKAHIAGWQSTYEDYIDSAILKRMTFAKLRPFREKILEKGTQQCFVAMAQDKVVGFIDVGPARDLKHLAPGELYAIYILVSYQRQNIGKTLMDAGKDWFKNHNYSSFYTLALEENAKAQKFYESQGGIRSEVTLNPKIGRKVHTELCYLWKDF